MNLLAPYLPMDRRQALVSGIPIPDRVTGAALFADISGFTPLTAALADELGRQRGAEEVLNYINPIYENIITQLYQFRGSVVGFAGDSITCWLDGDDGSRGVACALAMQEIMNRFATVTTPGGTRVALSIKVALAAGPARRFLVGNPEYHNFEALAGATLERMAAAEGQAERGETVVSQEVVDSLGDALAVSRWRCESDTGRPFAVVGGLGMPVASDPWPELAPDRLREDRVQAWVDGPVRARLLSGSAYLAELRPATSLFLKFGGIDYDGDDSAGDSLDAFIRWVQTVLARYDGYMLQLTIGDKGSNLLAVFGAPVAHDDDNARAVAAALDLQARPPGLEAISDVRIGISEGLVWAGACGGRVRCIYTVMGDEVNMAARLMGKAASGQILVNRHVADATARRFHYNPLGRIQVKGKTEPLPVSEAVAHRTGATALWSTLYSSPLLGRDSFLDEMLDYLAPARLGRGQVLRLEGAPGVGKSHLAAAFAARAAEGGWLVVLGSCQSTHQGTAYTPWRQLLLSLLDPGDEPVGDRVQRLTATITRANPEWVPRLPLLGDALDLPIAETAETEALEPRLRQQGLFALVAEIVQTWSERQPLLLVLEDVHWLDEASAALTVAVGRALSQARAALLLVQRPPLRPEQPILPQLDHLPYHRPLELDDLSAAGVEALISCRLGGRPSPLVNELVFAQAQGNPFFTEELVDALREAHYILPDGENTWVLSEEAFNALLDGNCLLKVQGEWQLVENPPLSSVRLDLPDSVHSTVLARMDRLPEPQKLTLKIASVIGRTFSLELLQAAHPLRPPLHRLQSEVEGMSERDFIRLERAGPQPVYLFKHNTTQEVAYGTLLFAQRKELHAAVAEWHERTYGDAPLAELTLASTLAPHYPLLVHHWHGAENPERERLYAGLAGEQAARQYANEGAARYFSRALSLSPPDNLEERYRLLLGREGIYDVLGRREAQAQDLADLEELAATLGDLHRRAAASLRQARYLDSTRDYPAALQAARQAAALAVEAGDREVEIQSHHEWGRILTQQGDYGAATVQLERALELARRDRNRLQEARALYDLGNIHYQGADYQLALPYYQQAQDIFQAIGHRPGEIQSLLMFGALTYQLGDYVAARACWEQALLLSRTIGWRFSEAYVLGNLGTNSCDLGDNEAARAFLERALVVCRETGETRSEAVSLDTLSLVFHALGENEHARKCAQRALALLRQIGNRRGEGYSLTHLGQVLAGLGDLTGAKEAYRQALLLRRELGQGGSALDDLAGLARVALAQDNLVEARSHAEEILTWIKAHGVEGIEYAVLVYLTCYRTLRATAGDDPAAQATARAVLKDGHALLTERAGRIQDEALRRRFLENVPFNRELAAAWAGDTIS